MNKPVWTWTPLNDNPADMCLVENVQTGEKFTVSGVYASVRLCKILNTAAEKETATRKIASGIRILITMLEDFKDSLMTLVSTERRN